MIKGGLKRAYALLYKIKEGREGRARRGTLANEIIIRPFARPLT